MTLDTYKKLTDVEKLQYDALLDLRNAIDDLSDQIKGLRLDLRAK